jgi:hypothetical protein
MRLPSRPMKITRNTLLFIGGMLGVAHETLVKDVDRPTLLLLFAAMIGLPAFIGSDERNNP